jgi:hypothetical protein
VYNKPAISIKNILQASATAAQIESYREKVRKGQTGDENHLFSVCFHVIPVVISMFRLPDFLTGDNIKCNGMKL